MNELRKESERWASPAADAAAKAMEGRRRFWLFEVTASAFATNNFDGPGVTVEGQN